MSDGVRPLVLAPHEVRAALRGPVLIVRAVRDQGAISDVCGGGVEPVVWWPIAANGEWLPCPLGSPGDRLLVREAYVIECCQEVGWYDPPYSDGRPLLIEEDGDWGRWWSQAHYRATDPTPELWDPESEEPACRWRSPVTMPRWASRLTVEVESVEVRRASTITEEEASACGVDPERIRVPTLLAMQMGGPQWMHQLSHRAGFRLWWEAGRRSWEDWAWFVRVRACDSAVRLVDSRLHGGREVRDGGGDRRG